MPRCFAEIVIHCSILSHGQQDISIAAENAEILEIAWLEDGCVSIVIIVCADIVQRSHG